MALAMAPDPALAAGGSGGAQMFTSFNPVVAGSYGSWTINYTAGEDFDHPQGGVIEIWIPTGWTPPQTSSPVSNGYVTFSDVPGYIDSVTTVGQRIRLRLGRPGAKFDAGDVIGIHYGSDAPAPNSTPAT